ncbi:MAG: taurine ABC transporter substrate-binding protein [Rhodospirillaceae bacterium]|nr:taurine ABC transporter substrate-binding protein [Rhodospirillaceae bacterium]
MALERYDRHVPFFMDMVENPDGIIIKSLEVGMAPPRRDGIDRHRRFYEDEEFDICEMSVSSYLTSKAKDLPYTAVPVFPRRLFSQNHMFVSTAANISTPKDLIGKKVCCRSFQTTMSVLAKGDLAFEYDVPWRELDWHTMSPELVAFPGQEEADLTMIDEPSAPERFIAGELAMMIHPHPPPAILEGLRNGSVQRMWPDLREECGRYFQKYDYPIMHLLVFKTALADAHPHLPRALMEMWEDAKHQAADFYEDPGYSEMAFARNAYEEEQEIFGTDPWPTGLSANRASVERFMKYLTDQTLIEAPYPVEQLFHESVLDS